MLHQIKILPLFLLSMTALPVHAEVSGSSVDEEWFAYEYGECTPRSPREMLVLQEMGMAKVTAKDTVENGKVVSTIMTLHGASPLDKVTIQYFRGEKRCEAVRQKEQKKQNIDVDRYR